MGCGCRLLVLCAFLFMAMPVHACITPVGDDTLVNGSLVICPNIYYLNDTNSNGLFVFSDNDTLDCNGSTFVGDLTGYGMYVNTKNNVTIQNCNVNYYATGVSLFRALNSTIYNGTFTGNGDRGLYVRYSNYSSITKITLSDNDIGLYVSSSNNNNIYEIYMNSNSNGLSITSSNHNVLSGGISNNDDPKAIVFTFSNNNTLQNYTTTLHSIELSSSSNNTLQNNTAHHGYYLTSNSDNNLFTGSNVTSGAQGFYMHTVRNNRFIGNTIMNTDQGANLFSLAINNTFINNTFGNNTRGFVILDRSTNNTIVRNRLYGNINVGLNSSTSNNTIYDNFFNNTINVYDLGNNSWNTTLTSGTNILGGTKLGGNYWATPTGNGCSQYSYDANGDGVSDTSTCTIAGGTDIDYLPLTVLPTQQAQTAIVSPSNNTYKRLNVSINLTYNNTANITISIINSTGDSATIAAVNNTYGPYTLTWQTNNYPNGVYNITALVIDANDATNNVTIIRKNITVDNTPPNVTWIWPAADGAFLSYSSPEITLTPIVGDTYLLRFSPTINLTEETKLASCAAGFRLYSPNSAGSGGSSSENLFDNGVTELFVTRSVTMTNPSTSELIFLLDYDCSDAAGNRVTDDIRLAHTDNRSPEILSYQQNVTQSHAGLNVSIREWNPEDDFLEYALTGQVNRTGIVALAQFIQKNNRTIDATLYNTLDENLTYTYNYTYDATQQFQNLLNGQYSLMLTAHDTLGNNGTTTVNFTVNDTAPPIWSQAITTTTSGATIVLTGDENATYVASIDGSQEGTESGVNITMSIDELEPRMTYNLTITGCDINNNCNISTTELTTATPGSNSYNTAGTRDASVAIAPTALDTTKTTRLLVSTWSPVKIIVENNVGRNVQHTIRATRIDKDGAEFTIQSEPIVIYLKLNETKQVDIDNDAVSDIAITLKNIRGTSTTIDVKSLAPSSAQTNESVAPTTEQIVRNDGTVQALEDNQVATEEIILVDGTNNDAASHATAQKTTLLLWSMVVVVLLVLFVVQYRVRHKHH